MQMENRQRTQRTSPLPPAGRPGRRAGPAPRGLTVGRAAEEWLASRAGTNKRSTLAVYRSVVERHIRPGLGDVPVGRLTAERLSAFLDQKLRGEGLAPSTVCGIVTVLRAVLKQARLRGEPFDAWEALARPRKRPRETPTLSAAHQRRLEGYLWAEPDPERLGVLLCLYTGLRVGELCALKWGDISPEGVITVRRSVQRVRSPGGDGEGGPRTVLHFDAPKSDASRRSIPAPSVLARALEAHRRPPECFFLTGDQTAFLEPRAMQRFFRACLEKAGVPPVNFHALRHTFATNCVQLGFDPKTLSRILGHSTVTLTLDTYVHPSLAAMRGLMERLNTPIWEEQP